MTLEERLLAVARDYCPLRLAVLIASEPMGNELREALWLCIDTNKHPSFTGNWGICWYNDNYWGRYGNEDAWDILPGLIFTELEGYDQCDTTVKMYRQVSVSFLSYLRAYRRVKAKTPHA